MSADATTHATVLAATDFSSPSERATEMAAALAQARGAQLVLLHVLEPLGAHLPELPLDPGLESDLRTRATEQLAAAAAAVRRRGVAVAERLEIGPAPADVIADLAAELEPLLVVVGSHGRRPVTRLFMGSVAEATVLRVRQPVVVVPTTGAAQAAAPAYPPTGRLWRIAVGLDPSTSSAAAIDWVRELRRHLDCDVIFVHVYWPAAEYARFGLEGPRDLFEADPSTIELLRGSLMPLIGTLPGHGETKVKIVPNWGSSGERLVDEAMQSGADLLVLGTHHRHGLSRLLHGGTVPPAIHTGSLPIVCISQPELDPVAAPLPHLRSIVAATDLSELGNRAIPHAYALARGEAGVVHLLHVHERALPRPAYAYAPDGANALTADERHALRAQLRSLVPPEASPHGIATDVIIVDGGSAAEVICQTAERVSADAICLGSQGRTGLGRLILGSVTAQVLHQATRPVFVVRRPAE